LTKFTLAHLPSSKGGNTPFIELNHEEVHEVEEEEDDDDDDDIDGD